MGRLIGLEEDLTREDPMEGFTSMNVNGSGLCLIRQHFPIIVFATQETNWYFIDRSKIVYKWNITKKKSLNY